jgi:hypothetical protein
MSYRDDVDALTARHTSLERELTDKTRELADAARVLEEARAKRRLPMLDNLRVATPCSASWDRMVGDDRVRHCHDCNKNVFELSGMTRDEAEALLVATNGNVCVRYYQRADGTILTADCAVGVSKRRKRRLIAAGAAALLAGGGLGARALATATPERLGHTMGAPVAMGVVAIPAVPVQPPPTLHMGLPPPPPPPPATPTMGRMAKRP